jgi:hypothetical protein
LQSRIVIRFVVGAPLRSPFRLLAMSIASPRHVLKQRYGLASLAAELEGARTA